MNRRPRLFAVAVVGAAVGLLSTGCGGGDGEAKGDGRAAGAGSRSSDSPGVSASASTSVERPRIELPSDLTYDFEWRRTGDKDKDAVLADGELFIKATDQAIANQDPLDPAYRFYSVGELAAATRKYVQRFVDHKARTTGVYRFYDESVTLRGDGAATLTYCEDQGKAYNRYVETGKVDRTPVTKNSYVFYDTSLKKNPDGVWVTQDMISERASGRCRP